MKPVSPNALENRSLAVCRTLYTLVLALTLAAWLEQDAIALYWRQTHHADSPLRFLKSIPAWASGAHVNDFSVQMNTALRDEITRFDTWAISAFNDLNTPPAPEYLALAKPPKHPDTGNNASPDSAGTSRENRTSLGKMEISVPGREPKTNMGKTLAVPSHEQAAQHAAPLPPNTASGAGATEINGLSALPKTGAPPVPVPADGPPRPLPDTTVRLTRKDHVLFVGDSLMQGVAPHVNASLYRRYAIRGFDLSRQSTGLAYPGFFNWPDQIKKTFLEKADIKLMVVFLGPNDPWDFPPPKGGAPYLKFRSESWENVYRERIRAMLEIAQKNGARVLWLAPPCMRKKELNLSMTYLNQLFSDEVSKLREFFLSTDNMVGCHEGRFDSYMDSGGKKIKARADDGIHFTLAGQKKIAEAVLSFIHFIPRETPS